MVHAVDNPKCFVRKFSDRVRLTNFLDVRLFFPFVDKKTEDFHFCTQFAPGLFWVSRLDFRLVNCRFHDTKLANRNALRKKTESVSFAFLVCRLSSLSYLVIFSPTGFLWVAVLVQGLWSIATSHWSNNIISIFRWFSHQGSTFPTKRRELDCKLCKRTLSDSKWSESSDEFHGCKQFQFRCKLLLGSMLCNKSNADENNSCHAIPTREEVFRKKADVNFNPVQHEIALISGDG